MCMPLDFLRIFNEWIIFARTNYNAEAVYTVLGMPAFGVKVMSEMSEVRAAFSKRESILYGTTDIQVPWPMQRCSTILKTSKKRKGISHFRAPNELQSNNESLGIRLSTIRWFKQGTSTWKHNVSVSHEPPLQNKWTRNHHIIVTPSRRHPAPHLSHWNADKILSD